MVAYPGISIVYITQFVQGAVMYVLHAGVITMYNVR